MTHLMPWFIGGPYAKAPAAVARMVQYEAVGGREGVLLPTHCVVTALPTPGQAVLAQPGAYSVNAYTQPNQAYGGMITAADQAPVDPTTSSGGRSDLVVVRIENPNVSGEPWQPPLDQTNGPYAFTRVIKNVPPGTTKFRQLGTNDSAFALARLDIPASTATITQSMITDLRGAASGGFPIAAAPTPAGASFANFLNGTGQQNLFPPSKTGSALSTNWGPFPSQAAWNVPFPSWATAATLYLSLNAYYSDNIQGSFRLNIGNGALVTGGSSYLAEVPINTQTGGGKSVYTNYGLRGLFLAGGNVAIPAALRGTTQTVWAEAMTIDNAARQYQGQMIYGAQCIAYLSISFTQDAVTT